MCTDRACIVHTRTSDVPDVVGDLDYHAVTYVGDKAVWTADNPEIGIEAAIHALGGVDPVNVFVTRVYRLDSETSTLWELVGLDADAVSGRQLFRQAHTPMPEYPEVETSEQSIALLTERVKTNHELIVDMVRGGIIEAESK
jgi:hypothetical protein